MTLRPPTINKTLKSVKANFSQFHPNRQFHFQKGAVNPTNAVLFDFIYILYTMSVQKITLEELIVCPEAMRLLVLHTPTPIDLTMLTRCTNLIKLDISNNALKEVPYLGHLEQLKFLFLHGNHLSLSSLKAIFMKNSEKSALCSNITWVTFWGNGN